MLSPVAPVCVTACAAPDSVSVQQVEVTATPEGPPNLIYERVQLLDAARFQLPLAGSRCPGGCMDWEKLQREDVRSKVSATLRRASQSVLHAP